MIIVPGLVSFGHVPKLVFLAKTVILATLKMIHSIPLKKFCILFEDVIFHE